MIHEQHACYQVICTRLQICHVTAISGSHRLEVSQKGSDSNSRKALLSQMSAWVQATFVANLFGCARPHDHKVTMRSCFRIQGHYPLA